MKKIEVLGIKYQRITLMNLHFKKKYVGKKKKTLFLKK